MAEENQGHPACVDDYFQAAALAWPELERHGSQPQVFTGPAAQVYHAALTQLVAAGQRFKRLDPRRGLQVRTATGRLNIPTRYQGFSWRADEIDSLLPVGDYSTRELNHIYRNHGLGVAMIAAHYRRPGERFRRVNQVFAATVVLRPACDGLKSSSEYVLDVFDPLRVSTISTACGPASLARDLSAPIAFRMSQENRDYVTRFLQPGTTDENAGLFMLEPYQPGKIPVVFIHGLLSDPTTWANLANEIQSQPDLMERYQIWGFEYATGEPFLASAAALRQQLREVVPTVDPCGTDEALAQMVLVGHSMGGLIAKLQITWGGDPLWSAVSCVPFERLVASPSARQTLAASFYFEPSPLISRVVFIGTPHRGSPWARRPVGRLASQLVEESPAVIGAHDQLVCDNPDAFSTEFTRVFPPALTCWSPLVRCCRRSIACRVTRGCKSIRFMAAGTGYWAAGIRTVLYLSTAPGLRVR